MRKYPIVWFYILAFSITWIGMIPGALGSHGIAPFNSPYVQFLIIFSNFGPGIAAIAVVRYASGQDGLHSWLRRSLQWRVGWRGYALPVLQERYSWRVASLILGGVWGAWHLPLFSIADTAQSHIPVGLFMVSTIALSVLFAWLFNRTRESVLPALGLHTSVNAWAWIIPVMVMPDGNNLRPYGPSVGLLVLIALGLLCSANPYLPTRSPKAAV